MIRARRLGPQTAALLTTTAIILLGPTLVLEPVAASAAAARTEVKTKEQQRPQWLQTALPARTHAVTGRVQVFARPAADAKRVMTMRRFRPDYRTTVFYVIGATTGAGGKRFYEIRRPYRPNNRTGWVRAAQLGPLQHVATEITIDRSRRKLSLRRNGRRILTAPVAVGKSSAPTPLGSFYLTAEFKPTLPILGAWAIETSAGAKVTDWPGGGVIGIHGTNQPELIGTAASHGCIRMKNHDVRRLRGLVEPGTGLRIKA